MPSTVFQGITTNQLVNFCFHDTKAVRRRRWSGKWKACSGCQRRCQHLQLQPRSRGAQRCRGHMGGWGECFELGLSMASTNVYWRLLAYIPRNGRLILMKVMDLEEPRGTLFSDWSVLFTESFWSYDSWLVVWNMNFVTFQIIIGNNHSNWLIFFAGVETTNQIHMIWKKQWQHDSDIPLMCCTHQTKSLRSFGLLLIYHTVRYEADSHNCPNSPSTCFMTVVISGWVVSLRLNLIPFIAILVHWP